jgi:hypothetical protein
MVNFQLSRNLAQVHAIHVHLGSSFAQALRIALQFWFGRVLAIAVHTAIPLRTCIRSACFVLTRRFVAMWTLYHFPILAHPFRHSLYCEDTNFAKYPFRAALARLLLLERRHSIPDIHIHMNGLAVLHLHIQAGLICHRST